MKQVVDHAVALRPAAAGIRSLFHAGRGASVTRAGIFVSALSFGCAVPAFAQTASEDQQADALEKVVVRAGDFWLPADVLSAGNFFPFSRNLSGPFQSIPSL